MKTGLESLDVGAPDITYSGNQGPKSPQEDQRMMQQFQMQQQMEDMAGGENDRVRELLLLEETQGLSEEEKEELRALIKTISAQMPQGGMGDMPIEMDEGLGSMMQGPRTMAAFGGIMGADGRRAYGGGGSQDSVRGGGYQGRGGETTGGGAGSQAGGAGTGTDNQGSTGGGNNRDDSGDDVARPTYSEQYKKLPKADFQDVKEQYILGTPIKEGQVIPYAQELIGETSYDVIPGDEENELIRFKANNEIAEERRLAFEEEQRRRREEERLRLQELDRNRDVFVATQMPDEEDDEEEEEDADNDARTTRQSLPFDFSVNTDDLTQGRGGFFYNDGGRAGYMGGGIADLRQAAAFGGMMGDDGRRAYGLGSFFKKAFRGIKKVAKSPLGKAALFALGANYAPMLFGKSSLMKTGFGEGLGTFFKNAARKSLMSKEALAKPGSKLFNFANLDPFKAFSVATTAAPLVSSLFKGGEDDDDEFDYEKRKQAFLDQNPQFKIGAPTKRGTLPFADGGDVDDDDLIPRAALAKATKFYAFGGLAGLPPVTMQTAGQNVKSFPDDESMNMAQGPTMQSQMPMQRPMMDPRMMQQQGGMNPMMGNRMMAAMGGRMGYAEGGDEGELLDMGGMEKDYRNDGGFVPMGEYERKDDVPARLSKNEFVFTADAVRNAGGGNIDKGAEIMENMMKNLEDGGQVSKESQGLRGAREMFATQQRLGEVL